MTKVTADYGTGNAKETSYTLNASGANTKQALPSGHYNEFVYDDGGRVTNQYFKDSRANVVESYAYNYSPTGLPSYTYGYTRTELNGDVYTFVNDRMGRQKQEKKVNSGAVTQYQQDFTYDKNGNRLTMQQSGSGSGIASYSYAYTYDAQGKLTYIKDVARYYTGTITTDANGNITSVNEAWTGTANTWKTDFTFDYENRLTKTQISGTAGGKTYVFNSITHAYDGLNRLIKTTAGNNYGHVYDGNKLAGNANLTSSTNGTAWVNAANAAKPLASTQIQTVGATRYYNVSDERDPVRQVYTDAGTAGDTSQKSRYSEYKLIDGSAPTMVTYGGAIKQSELFRVRNISLNENSIVLPSANGSFEAAAISLNYEGTRVKSALIGRDLNPMGRGDGVYYFAGAMKIDVILPSFGSNSYYGSGNSVNNNGQRDTLGSTSANAANWAHYINRRTPKRPVINNCNDAYKWYQEQLADIEKARRIRSIVNEWRLGLVTAEFVVLEALLIDAITAAVIQLLRVNRMLPSGFSSAIDDLLSKTGPIGRIKIPIPGIRIPIGEIPIPKLPIPKLPEWLENTRKYLTNKMIGNTIATGVLTTLRHFWMQWCMFKQRWENAKYMAWDWHEWQSDNLVHYEQTVMCHDYRVLCMQIPNCKPNKCIINPYDDTPPTKPNVYKPCMDWFDNNIAGGWNRLTNPLGQFFDKIKHWQDGHGKELVPDPQYQTM